MVITSVKQQTLPNIHVGDVGTRFIVTIINENEQVINLATALTMTLRFLSPLRESKDYIASFYTNGADGNLEYVLEDGDIDVAGQWNYQAIITFTTGSWSTNIVPFTVYPNIPAPIP